MRGHHNIVLLMTAMLCSSQLFCLVEHILPTAHAATEFHASGHEPETAMHTVHPEHSPIHETTIHDAPLHPLKTTTYHDLIDPIHEEPVPSLPAIFAPALPPTVFEPSSDKTDLTPLDTPSGPSRTGRPPRDGAEAGEDRMILKSAESDRQLIERMQDRVTDFLECSGASKTEKHLSVTGELLERLNDAAQEAATAYAQARTTYASISVVPTKEAAFATLMTSIPGQQRTTEEGASRTIDQAAQQFRQALAAYGTALAQALRNLPPTKCRTLEREVQQRARELAQHLKEYAQLCDALPPASGQAIASPQMLYSTFVEKIKIA